LFEHGEASVWVALPQVVRSVDSGDPCADDQNVEIRLRHCEASCTDLPQVDIVRGEGAILSEFWQLRLANEILRKACAYFAMAELDRSDRR
jgi:hypothetical protein